MLTPQYLSNIPESVVKIYLDLESDIMVDIARRIKKTGNITDTAIWQAKKLEELGASREYIAKRIALALKMSEKEVLRIFNEACYKSLKKDENIYLRAKEKGLLPKAVPLNSAQGIKSVLMLGAVRTQNTMKNLTESLGRVANADLASYLDRSYLQVVSGAFDYKTAISNSVRTLAHQGIRTIDYTSGSKISIEAGVRRAVLTGVNKTAGEMSLEYAEECENDLVITSQHIGARPTHAVWQGKIFSLSGNSNRYPDFRSSTGYGTAEGLCGINCRHSFSPYFPGMSLKPDERIGLTENRRQYELEQEQRFNERRIRYFKREAMVYEAGGLDPTKSNQKVAYWQEQQRDLIKANPSLHRDYFREKVE